MERQEIEHVALLKLDCEGAEHEIVASLTPEIASRIDYIVMELHSVVGWDNSSTIARLKSLGYEHEICYTHLFSRRRQETGNG